MPSRGPASRKDVVASHRALKLPAGRHRAVRQPRALTLPAVTVAMLALVTAGASGSLAEAEQRDSADSSDAAISAVAYSRPSGDERVSRRASRLPVRSENSNHRPRPRPRAGSHRWVLPVSDYHLSAGFGEVSSLWSSAHTGLDFAAADGSPVVAVAGGTVRRLGYDGPYGNKVELRHRDGTVTWYCHLSSFHVSRGDELRAGEKLGTVGSTGNVTGAHLHLEVRSGGRPIDPAAALSARGLRL